jgi:hypothetical protein
MTADDLKRAKDCFEAPWSNSVSSEREQWGRELLAEVEHLRAFAREVQGWCEPAGTGKPTGDELNICSELYEKANIALGEQ